MAGPPRWLVVASALALAPAMAGCADSGQSVNEVAKSAATETSSSAASTTPVSTSASATSSSAVHADGLYDSLRELRAAITSLGVSCDASIWSQAPKPSIDAAKEQASCGPDLTLVTYSKDNLDPAKALVGLEAMAAKNLADGSKALVILRGANWAVLGTAQAIQTLGAGLGGETVNTAPTTDQFGDPTG